VVDVDAPEADDPTHRHESGAAVTYTFGLATLSAGNRASIGPEMGSIKHILSGKMSHRARTGESVDRRTRAHDGVKYSLNMIIITKVYLNADTTAVCYVNPGCGRRPGEH
jgi:hypothetical protein